MANPFQTNLFTMPKMPELPELYEALIGSPQAEQLEVTGNQFDNYYQNQKLWNSGEKVNSGIDYEKVTSPTQFKDPLNDIQNEFTGTYFL